MMLTGKLFTNKRKKHQSLNLPLFTDLALDSLFTEWGVHYLATRVNDKTGKYSTNNHDSSNLSAKNLSADSQTARQTDYYTLVAK